MSSAPDPQTVKHILTNAVEKYNRLEFIDTDPIQIPHSFSQPSDIEIAGFLTATISWGQRKTIINNASNWMSYMDQAPTDFLLNASELELQQVSKRMIHRTFQPQDALFYLRRLQAIYTSSSSLRQLFEKKFAEYGNPSDAISEVRSQFMSPVPPPRTLKHFSNPATGSSAKRMNMFLRWMVRRDHSGVDFGLWTGISPAQLHIPLDVHSGNVARELGILKRKQNDQKAVIELTEYLRTLDPADPVKFDFALFGLGAFKNNMFI
jgi:uncharacterized protein (TIGR02757 family)